MSDELEVTAKLELAILEALSGSYQAAGTALHGVVLYAAQQGGTIADSDRIIVSALNPDDELAHAGIYDVEVNVVLFTKATTAEGEVNVRATPHQNRAADLAAIFDDPNHDDLLGLINAVAGIGVSCFMRDGNDDRGKSEDGTSWVWRRKLIFTAHLTDAASSYPSADSTQITADSDTVTADAAP
jgi:hypothetical protein